MSFCTNHFSISEHVKLRKFLMESNLMNSISPLLCIDRASIDGHFKLNLNQSHTPLEKSSLNPTNLVDFLQNVWCRRPAVTLLGHRYMGQEVLRLERRRPRPIDSSDYLKNKKSDIIRLLEFNIIYTVTPTLNPNVISASFTFTTSLQTNLGISADVSLSL